MTRKNQNLIDVDAIPYFPFKLTSDDSKWLIKNPVTSYEFELNQAAYWMVKLCDGYRTWGEIIYKLCQAYQTKNKHVISHSEPVLQELTDEGFIWWRRQRIKWWRLPPPLAVLWDLTTECNLNCRHCVVSGGLSNPNKLSLDKCLDLANELADFGIQHLILSGGEPLMRSDFFKITEHAAKLGFSLQIATNATLITKQVAQRLAAIGVNVQASLDGATPKVHDSFRQCPGTWERAMQGIRNLIKEGVPVMVASTITKANIHQIPDLYDIATELGAHTFRILPFVPFGRGLTAWELEVSPQEMREVTEYLLKRQEEGGIPVAEMEFECTFKPPPIEHADLNTRIGCDGAVTYCTINSSGEVLPCNFFSGIQAENVREHSFEWIWENSHVLNYFRSLTVSDIHGVCKNCKWLSLCRGSCVASNFVHGDIFQSNCHCWLVK